MAYLKDMRAVLTLFCLSVVTVVSGQFIPEPTEYNPDSNGDQFISVYDLQSLLAVYGSGFLASDSVQIQSIEFLTPQEGDTLEIDESSDIVYVTAYHPFGNQFLVLPQGDGWKSMIVFFTGDYSLGDFWSQVELLKYNDGTSIECDEPFCRQGGVPIRSKERRHMILIRGHDGIWSVPKSFEL